MEGRNRFSALLRTIVPQRMTQLRCAYAGAVLSSGLASAASEVALPLVSPGKAIPSFRLRRFPQMEREAKKASLL
jgi:hypothetical protein